MDTSLHWFSYIFSVAIGLLCGYVVGFKWQRPRSKAAIISIIVIGVLSPWIVLHGWAFCATIAGENFGLHFGTFLGPLCALLILGYAVRRGQKGGVVPRL